MSVWDLIFAVAAENGEEVLYLGLFFAKRVDSKNLDYSAQIKLITFVNV